LCVENDFNVYAILLLQKIQQAGSACLYYVVKDEPKERINAKVKQKVLATLLNAMFGHKDDEAMMRNGCLTLCQFDIPQDLVSNFKNYIIIYCNDLRV